MPALKLLSRPGFREPLAGITAQRLEHPETRMASVLGDNKGLVHQAGQRFQHPRVLRAWETRSSGTWRWGFSDPPELKSVRRLNRSRDCSDYRPTSGKVSRCPVPSAIPGSRKALLDVKRSLAVSKPDQSILDDHR